MAGESSPPSAALTGPASSGRRVYAPGPMAFVFACSLAKSMTRVLGFDVEGFNHEATLMRLGGSGLVSWSTGSGAVQLHVLDRLHWRGHSAGQPRWHWTDNP